MKLLFKQIVITILIALSSLTFAEERLPVDIHIGFEKNIATLINLSSGERISEQESEYNDQPVFKILSPIKLGCLGKIQTWDNRTDAQRKGCIGFGARFSAAQKRLSGSWFHVDSSSDSETLYYYRSAQFAGEVLFGQLSEVSLAIGLGLRVGVNNYDLLVEKGDSILLHQLNKSTPFVSWSFYLDLQTILTWPFLGTFKWPFSPVFFMYSYEETFEGYNKLGPLITGNGSEAEVELKTLTHTLTLELIF